MRETMRLALKSRAAKKDNSIFICVHLPSTNPTWQRVCQSKLCRSLNDKRENPARCGDALFFRDDFPLKRVPNYRRAPKCSRVLEECSGIWTKELNRAIRRVLRRSKEPLNLDERFRVS